VALVVLFHRGEFIGSARLDAQNGSFEFIGC
jgi:hypothetical protein